MGSHGLNKNTVNEIKTWPDKFRSESKRRNFISKAVTTAQTTSFVLKQLFGTAPDLKTIDKKLVPHNKEDLSSDINETG